MKKIFAFLLGLIALTSQSQAQTRYELFYESNRPYAIEPEIEVVVGLTPEQKAKLDAALLARKNDPASLEAEQEMKAQPSKETPEYAAAKEKREKARSAAKTVYFEVIKSTLTPEQQDLIKKLQRFASGIQKEAEASMLETTSGEKPAWNDLMDRCAEIGRPRLSDVLTPEQLALLPAPAASPAPKE